MKEKLVKLAIQTLKRRIDGGILIIKWVLITMLLELKRTHNCFNFRAWYFTPFLTFLVLKTFAFGAFQMEFWEIFGHLVSNIWTVGTFLPQIHTSLDQILFCLWGPK
jgi:hypothetical protein